MKRGDFCWSLIPLKPDIEKLEVCISHKDHTEQSANYLTIIGRLFPDTIYFMYLQILLLRNKAPIIKINSTAGKVPFLPTNSGNEEGNRGEQGHNSNPVVEHLKN